MHMRSVVLTAAVLTMAWQSVGAQTSGFSEFHTWTDLATVVNISDRFRYDGDYGLRGVVTDDNWTLFYLRPSVRYRPQPWLTLHGGVGLFYNILPDSDLPELRPFVGGSTSTTPGTAWWESSTRRPGSHPTTRSR